MLYFKHIYLQLKHIHLLVFMFRMLFFAFLSPRKSLAANMPHLIAIVGFAVLRIVAAACGGVVATTYVVFRLGLLLLLGGVVVDERPRPLSLPGRPGVSKLVCC
jgi:hypothetical protein